MAMSGRAGKLSLSSKSGALHTAFPRSIPEHAVNVLKRIFPAEPAALRLLNAVFGGRGYERATALTLIGVGRGRTAESWELRCLAILLLEHYMRRLSPRNLNEHKILVDSLGIKLSNSNLRRDLLKQGYSQTKLKGFVAELRRRLARTDYLNSAISTPGASRDDWEDFLSLIKQESRLTLARYCFTPEEVASRIRDQVKISSGTKHVRDRHRQWFNRMGQRVMQQLPALESGIIRELARGERIYWVDDRTSSALNSLVEFPLTSAVLTIKPPGSHLEFEIKRAGVRGLRKLNVISTRHDGTKAPPSHQLYGGSIGWLGRREAENASLFAYIYSLVHGKPAPICLTVQILSLRTLPIADKEAHIVDYLTCNKVFGEGFEQMRKSLRSCVDTLPPDSGIGVHNYDGPVGLTLQFLAQTGPQQALLINTTSFRLEQLALYLSEEGPKRYFDQGLGVAHTPADARRLADAVLSETLGVYDRPATHYRGYRDYVLSSLAANRPRADENFLECMRQAGEFWGTLLGVRGYSDGESFVTRNVGLRSAWERGRWSIRMLFMDHDDLFVLGKKKRYFWPYRAILGMYRDEVHVIGRCLEGHQVKGEFGVLREIYDVNETTAEAGRNVLQRSMRQAYEETLRAVESKPELRELFFEPFISCLRDWDSVVRMYLEPPGGGDVWKARASDYLRNKSYEPERIGNYLRSVDEHRDLLQRMAFLYQSR
jgi:hypothetical protein